MSRDTDKSSSIIKTKEISVSKKTEVNWGVWQSLLFTVVLFLGAQLAALQIVGVYGIFKHLNSAELQGWINTVIGQFWYVVFAETLTVLFIWLYIRHRKSSFKVLGFGKPKSRDLAYVFIGFIIYYPILIIAIDLLSALVHLNPNQTQVTGFGNNITGWPLILVFISLVILPPIAEEITFRGFLFSGLKKSLPKVWAIVITSVIFASPHLLEGENGSLLWVAFVDTFILSCVLCWLRDKTGRLYSSMGLHALKNFLAFYSIYLTPLIHIK